MRDFSADPQAIMDAHAKSFSWAARFLSGRARSQAAQLYAFARLMDDLIDEPALGPIDQRLAHFELNGRQVLGVVRDTSASYQVGVMLQSLGIDQRVVSNFLDALKADAQTRHLQSLPEVLIFAYGVAGTVGQMMRAILGASPAADAHAVTLGMAMQLTNIARDVLEDARQGRCYLPAQWLPADWQLAKMLQGCAETRAQAFVAIQRLLAQAETLYALAEQGFDTIPMPNRRAVKIAAVLYRGIGQKIMNMPASAYWDQRVQLSSGKKLAGVLQVFLGVHSKPVSYGANPLHAYSSDLQAIPGFPQALV